MSAIRTYNVEAGFPVLDEARRLVIEGIKKAKREGVKVLKVFMVTADPARAERSASDCRNHFGCGKKKVSSRILSSVRIFRFSTRRCWRCWKPYRNCAATPT